MTFFSSLLSSRLGIAGIGAALFLCLFGWHKIQVGILNHQATVLESEKIEEKTRRKACEFNLDDVRTALTKQNELVDLAGAESDRRVAEAEARALAMVTSLDLVDRMVSGPTGHNEMNLFWIDLFGRVIE